MNGYLNIDHRKTIATDCICDARNLPFKEGYFEVIENYHVIEHILRNDLESTILSWYHFLAHGGKLVIECPDFDTAVKEYLEGNLSMLDSIFGLQRYPGDIHYFGYNFVRLKNLLERCGFKNVVQFPAQDYHTKNEPCLHVECYK